MGARPLKNWCRGYEKPTKKGVDICANYTVVNLKPHCLIGFKAGLWCHIPREEDSHE